MNLVLFEDAVSHVCRIVRLLRQPRGSAMLIGLGGSGKQSLTRLAAFVCESEVCQIETTASYSAVDFREDLKNAMRTAGVDGKSVVFVLNDTQASVWMLCCCIFLRW